MDDFNRNLSVWLIACAIMGGVLGYTQCEHSIEATLISAAWMVFMGYIFGGTVLYLGSIAD